MNVTDACGQTPLIISAVCGYDKCLDSLIKAGVDINADVNYTKVWFNIPNVGLIFPKCKRSQIAYKCRH